MVPTALLGWSPLPRGRPPSGPWPACALRLSCARRKVGTESGDCRQCSPVAPPTSGTDLPARPPLCGRMPYPCCDLAFGTGTIAALALSWSPRRIANSHRINAEQGGETENEWSVT